MVQAIESLHRRKFPTQTTLSEEKFIELKNSIMKLNLSTEQMNFIAAKLEYANEIVLRKRLEYILFHELNELQNLFRDKNGISSFINKIVNTRNYLTHYDEKLKSKTASENTLREITDKLHLIVYFWLLSILGLDQFFLKKMFKRHWKYKKFFIKE